MRHLDLFSGIGGFSLAASWIWGSQHELVSFCERDEFCQRVLKKHWPDVPCISDIHDVRGDNIGAVDLLTGGFPCQPFSVAGKRRGSEDDRYLWPQMLRVIQEVQPRWVLGENVHGIVNLALDAVLADLEGEGYEVQAFLVPACGVNAPHRRNRVWIIANTQSAKRKLSRNTRERRTGFANGSCDDERDVSDSKHKGRDDWRDNDGYSNQNNGRTTSQDDGRQGWVCANISSDSSVVSDAASEQTGRQTAAWSTESPFCGVADGIPRRMDRLRSLGNAIVPQVAAVFFDAMKHVDLLYNLN